jgi:cell wall-associated NlpC family hydrolase
MRFEMKEIMRAVIYLCCAMGCWACNYTIPNSDEGMQKSVVIDSAAAYSSTDSAVADSGAGIFDSSRLDNTSNFDTAEVKAGEVIDTKNIHPDDLVRFAETLIGIPYRYGSTNPSVGFDCSGFITYVFNHFHIKVPRSSIDFTNVGKEIPVQSARRGDIILFTGTDSTERFVGHMGIIVSNTDTLKFIHSTSGKQYGVTITPLNKYYQGRFVKTLRVFKQNDDG